MQSRDGMYEQIAIAGARRMAHGQSRPESIAELRAITIGIVDRPHRDVVISRELAREILTALDNASKLGAHVRTYVQRSDVSAWADSLRASASEAAMRLRRVANLQSFSRPNSGRDDGEAA